ncbi:DNA-3-methyladenine glycosylase [Pseudoclavibacter sp. AY1F1]|uniref:DNA-3-methyladenine glycosylase family protein n=1 Tax=Pseudoclavibacter sp. AY1F1 TaxID=2080583 RepID=UPI001CA4DFEC|nr:hypothetical protein [Pseudoclavibacter sp. AY1F1]
MPDQGTPGIPSTPSFESFHPVTGPWSLATSRRFWEGFAPSELAPQGEANQIAATFLSDTDWHRVEATIGQVAGGVSVSVRGDGDLESATRQVLRFMSLDIDGSGWPAVGQRDPIIGELQRDLPGFRPCGFSSPYEAAAWSVLSQRVPMRQAATLSKRLTEQHGDRGAFPAPAVLRSLDLDLPGRKAEYLRAVATAALDGVLEGRRLRSLDAGEALRQVREILGIGPFAAELIVIRGANFPDVLPRNEHRLDAEIAEQYGADRPIEEITQHWRPFRAWAGVHLRASRENRTHEIARGRGPSRH